MHAVFIATEKKGFQRNCDPEFSFKCCCCVGTVRIKEGAAQEILVIVLAGRCNGKSRNVSETSCEMAVRSDASEKVHGNIPHLAPTISSACRPS